MKNVLLISLGSSFGGTEVYVHELVKLLGQDVAFTALISESRLQDLLERQDINCVRIPARKRILKPLQLLQAMLQMCTLICGCGIDAVIINGYSEILLVPVARALGVTAFSTRHLTFDIECKHWWQDPGRFIARTVYTALADCCDCVIAVSETVGSELRSLNPKANIRVIPSWVTPTLSVRSALEERTRVNILFVGRLTKLKGLQDLLEALRMLPSNGAPNWTLTVVGQGDYEAELRRHAGALPVRFVGFQADMAPFYAAADIFVNPSRGPEGLPLVTLEAMANGLPMILSDIPVFLEVSAHGSDALIFPVAEPTILAARLQEMISRPDLRDKYGYASTRGVAERYAPDAALHAYRTLLQEPS